MVLFKCIFFEIFVQKDRFLPGVAMDPTASHSRYQVLQQLWFCRLQELVNGESALSNMLLHAVSR